ncbi:tail fiber assembly protein [Citrobacter youngae]|uniref:tail fiber assembly protein n=1 Tax=Citrobacter youngae TaxID=133448 RepID=UPI00397DD9B4
MEKAVLNKYGIATEAGNITVYNYDSKTREYLSSSVEFLAVGVGIPAHSCTDAPVEKKEGFAVCRTASLDGWEYITDHRGETVFDKQTGQPVELTALGNYPDSVTTIAPSTLYDKWNGSTWVTDTDAKNDAARDEFEQKKKALRAIAEAEIDWLQDAVDAGIATEEETARLAAWRKYRVLLMRVGPEKLDWPTPPEEQAS